MYALAVSGDQIKENLQQPRKIPGITKWLKIRNMIIIKYIHILEIADRVKTPNSNYDKLNCEAAGYHPVAYLVPCQISVFAEIIKG